MNKNELTNEIEKATGFTHSPYAVDKVVDLNFSNSLNAILLASRSNLALTAK